MLQTSQAQKSTQPYVSPLSLTTCSSPQQICSGGGRSAPWRPRQRSLSGHRSSAARGMRSRRGRHPAACANGSCRLAPPTQPTLQTGLRRDASGSRKQLEALPPPPTSRSASQGQAAHPWLRVITPCSSSSSGSRSKAMVLAPAPATTPVATRRAAHRQCHRQQRAPCELLYSNRYTALQSYQGSVPCWT